MRGFPLVNGFAVILCLILVGIPLIVLTQEPRGSLAITPERPPEDDGTVPAWVRLKFAHPPLQIALSHLGLQLWETDDPEEMTGGTEIRLNIPPEGIDLILEARWETGTPETAIQLELEAESLTTRTAVAWGEEELVEVLTFQWRGLSQ